MHRIKHHCKCGLFNWTGKEWSAELAEGVIMTLGIKPEGRNGYCYVCGRSLDRDGWASLMVLAKGDYDGTS